MPLDAKRPLTASRLLAASAVGVVACAGLLATAGAASATVSPDVVIAEVYGGGGNTGATFKNDFVELYNTSDTAVNMSGWTIQYASATGAFSAGNSTTLPTGTTVAPGRYFLVQESAGTGGTTNLPTPDATGSLALSATGGKVALATSATVVTGPAGANVRDFVGFGTATTFEGTAAAPAPSNTTSDTRHSVNGVPTDTDDNSNDFTAGGVTATNMAGATASGPAAPSSSCTTAGTTTIEAIEGSAIVSPLAKGTAVSCVPGIVTGIEGTSYWIQDPTGDGNPNTSDGLYLYSSAGPVPSVGSSVLVSGTVNNFGSGFSDETALSITTPELDASTATILSTGNALPAPVVIGNAPGDQLPPRENVSSDTGDVQASGMPFNRTTDALDFWRSLLAMRVQIRDARVVGPSATGGHGPSVVPGDGVDVGTPTPSNGVLYDAYTDPNTRVIQTYDNAISGGLPATTVGDTDVSATAPVVGVLDFFGNPELELTAQPVFTSGGLAPQTTPYVGAGASLSVATYNVENLNPQSPASKYAALAGQIVNNLAKPNLIAVEEVQDNSGTTDNDGVVSASQTIAMLEAAISKAGGPAYSDTEIDPQADSDGGQPGGNIRQIFLYNPAVVSLVSKPGGGTTVADSVVTDADGTTELTQSPGRIDPTNAAWNSSRKPLVAQFTLNATGKRFFAIGNHFIAKLGDAPLYARNQPAAMASAAQRIAQSTAENAFVQQLEQDPNASVVALGDFNDYTFSASQATLRGTQLQDLFTKLPANQQYDYDFNGQSQTLDHILVSGPLFTGALFAPVHVNAEYANQVSDHDPEVALLTPGVTATASLPESPLVALLPLAGLGVLLLGYAIRRRRVIG